MTAEEKAQPTAGPMHAADSEAEASPAPAILAGGAAFSAACCWFGLGVRNMDAMMKSRTILARGVRALNNASLGVAMMSVEHAAAAAKGMSNCRTVADWIDVQNCIVKLGIDRMVGGAWMLSNMTMQVAEDASIPLTRRMGATYDEFSTTSVA